MRIEQSHFLPTLLNSNDTGWAFLSMRPNRRAFVFVHGFAGSSVDTWRQFQSLIQYRHKGRDLIFYGYDGIYASVTPSAYEFRKFLAVLFENPRQVMKSVDDWPATRKRSFRYDELTVVAHSMGAVVARLALLRAVQAHAEWTKKVQLVLFAPAHLGANVDLLAALGLGSGRKLVHKLLRMHLPPFRDLDCSISTILKPLRDQSEIAIQEGHRCLVAQKVIHAKYDRVVQFDENFCGDPPSDFLPGTHTSICKPTSDFTSPLEFL